jgi:hypothetical protein
VIEPGHAERAGANFMPAADVENALRHGIGQKVGGGPRSR